MNQNKMMKVRMDIIGLYGIPEQFCFIKENHILETSWNLIWLYKKCLRMGYDISGAKLEIKYYEHQMDPKTRRLKIVPVDEPSIKYHLDKYFHGKKVDKLLKKLDYTKKKGKQC